MTARDRIDVRLGKKARDTKLRRQIQQDRDKGVNISNLIKELLSAYYSGELDSFNRDGQPKAVATISERELQERAKAKAAIKGMSFKGLGGGDDSDDDD